MTNIKKIAKEAFYLYQRAFWYVGQAKGEILKPLGFWNETILILTFLAVTGQRPALGWIIGAYAGVLILMAAAGKAIVALGIVRYNTHISNRQNDELMLVLKKLDDIETLIKNQHGK